MCQFVHKGKKIRQFEQTPTTLKKGTPSFPPTTPLPTLPPLPIATAPFFSPIGLADSSRQSLPPQLPTSHQYRVLGSASAFVSHTRALHEKIRDKIMKIMLIIKFLLIFIVD